MKKTACSLLVMLLLLLPGCARREQQEAPSDFLEGRTPQAASQAPSTEDLFTLTDQATGQTFTLSREELLPAALACEMSPNVPAEALKAQAAACYTLFCFRRDREGTIPCNTETWLVWTDEEHLRARWGEACDDYMALYAEACQAVAGQLLTDGEGKPILSSYFAVSAGATEAAENVWQAGRSYLRPVACPGDLFSENYLSSVWLSEESLLAAAESALPGRVLQPDPDPDLWLTEVQRSPSGYITAAKLCGVSVTGTQLRSMFGLRSAAFSLSREEGGFRFTVQGWGHGVGMSQTQAIFLAGQGLSWQEILAYFYQDVTLTTAEESAQAVR